MTNEITAVLFKGSGPFSLPPIHHPKVAMTEDRMCMVTGLLPDAGDDTQRYVQFSMSLDSAMQLLALLQRFQKAYSLPLPTGTIEDRRLQ